MSATPRVQKLSDDLYNQAIDQRERTMAFHGLACTLEREVNQLRGAIASGQQNCDDVFNDMRAALNAEREKVSKLRAALLTLRDEQNGAPSETRRALWQMAMDEAGLALAQTEETT